jgi:hypothetical protein
MFKAIKKDENRFRKNHGKVKIKNAILIFILKVKTGKELIN